MSKKKKQIYFILFLIILLLIFKKCNNQGFFTDRQNSCIEQAMENGATYEEAVEGCEDAAIDTNSR